MATKTIGIILNGATGRICSTQHLANALGPIRDDGGLAVGGDRIVPLLLLAGRDAARLEPIARQHKAEWTTDLDAALANPDYAIFFDAAATHRRKAMLEKAIAAGKHIYAEKPVALSAEAGREILRQAQVRGIRHGAVEDKLGLPGLAKLAKLAASDFFGRVVGFRIEFGWWVFDGSEIPSQRPSWNYQRATGGGLILDMYPHWRYIIENTLGPINRVVTSLSTAQPERIDEQGSRYTVDVEDSATTLLELASGATGIILSSWATRVRRDDLLTFQIDGTKGSAVAGLHKCWTSTNAQTPPVRHFSIAKDAAVDYRGHWSEVADPGPFKNPYRIGWENFLEHVATDAPMRADLSAGVRDVAFAEACYRSMKEAKWINLEPR